MFNRKNKEFLIEIARESIKSRLEDYEYMPRKPAEEILNEKLGVFVTLKIDGNLRGCIGYIQGYKPLYIAVYEMAAEAAFNDPRFPALNTNEFKLIDIEISVMSPLKSINNIEEIQVGVHGLFVKRGYHSGLLLPQVADEWGYNRKEFLMSVCMKAGMNKQCYNDDETEIFIFSADIIKEDYYE